MERAVVIRDAKNSMDGIRAEGRWLAQHYPGSTKKSQALLMNNGKKYDLIEIETSEGKRVSVYFDITSFFGVF
jgi:hypothetical protein